MLAPHGGQPSRHDCLLSRADFSPEMRSCFFRSFSATRRQDEGFFPFPPIRGLP